MPHSELYQGQLVVRLTSCVQWSSEAATQPRAKDTLGPDLCSFFGKAGLEAQRRSCGGINCTDLLKLSTMIPPMNGSESDIKDLLLLAAKPYGDF